MLSLLDEWPWEVGGVIIGGYACMAYGPPRYSQDVDIVVSRESARHFQGWMIARGFQRDKKQEGKPQNFSGRVTRFRTEGVTLDLLEGAVRDREAQVDVPAAWIAADARLVKLTTMNLSTQKLVRIVRPEGLWALKLQAGRDQDLSDLFAITPEPVVESEVTEVFRELMIPSLKAKLGLVVSKLRSEKLYVDSLTRRSLGSPGSVVNQRAWSEFTSRVRRMVEPALGEQGGS